MKYTHHFTLQAAHLNDEGYPIWWRAIEAAKHERYEEAYELMQEMLSFIHGHNFRIEVELTGEVSPPPEQWLISDVELSGIVMEWDNRNLTVLDDFAKRGVRATTENMAEILASKVFSLRKSGVESVRVVVWETDDICAEVTYAR